jgi:hypothetical protein
MMTKAGLIGLVLLILVGMLIVVPARAQIDLSGDWVAREHEDWQDRTPGPEAVDYSGLPLSAEGRARALSYSASSLSMPERQCLYYPPHYVVIGPQGLKIWSESDPVTGAVLAWKINAFLDRDTVTIWMDGRPHPSKNAVHSFGGFTTGVWEGTTLTTYTTHMKEGYIRRNGVVASDQTTLTMHFSRHGNTLTVTALIDDPVYLTQPHILSRSWQLDPTANMAIVPAPCVPEAELPGLKGEGAVPHYLPGENPFVNEVTRMYHLPVEVVLGGAEALYPEFRKKLKDMYVAPPACVRYCCGWGGPPGTTGRGLNCFLDGTGRLWP